VHAFGHQRHQDEQGEGLQAFQHRPQEGVGLLFRLEGESHVEVGDGEVGVADFVAGVNAQLSPNHQPQDGRASASVHLDGFPSASKVTCDLTTLNEYLLLNDEFIEISSKLGKERARSVNWSARLSIFVECYIVVKLLLQAILCFLLFPVP